MQNVNNSKTIAASPANTYTRRQLQWHVYLENFDKKSCHCSAHLPVQAAGKSTIKSKAACGELKCGEMLLVANMYAMATQMS